MSSRLALGAALCVGVAAAFVAPVAPVASTASTALRSVLEELDGVTAPCGPWDPLGLADYGTEKTLAWYRAAEIKHGRVAMAATVGWIVNEMGITFPGDVATGVPFASLGKGVDAWAACAGSVRDGNRRRRCFLGRLRTTRRTHPKA